MDFTEGKILKKLIRFTIPIIIMQFLNQAYSIVDEVIVARFVSEQALSVLSTVNSALLVGYCIMNGISSAVTILIGNLYGSKDITKLQNSARTLLFYGTAVSVAIFFIYTIFSGVIFGWLKVPDEIMDESRALMWIYAAALIPTFMCSISTSILNGLGSSKTPMAISVFAQLLNIGLDFLTVAGFGWGIKGAAWASFASVVAAFLLTYMQVEKNMRKLSSELDSTPNGSIVASHSIALGRKAKSNTLGLGLLFHIDNSCMKVFVPLAVPSIVQQSITSIGNLMLQVLVNKEGVAYINGYTVGNTINGLFLLLVMSCIVGFETFAAQNIGAKQYDRVRSGFKGLLLFGTLLCFVISFFTVVCANPLIHLYLTDSASTSFSFARTYLIFLIPNYFLILWKYSVDAIFKAQLKVYLFTISSFISLGVRIVLGYALCAHFGLLALAVAIMIGNAVAMLFDWIYLSRELTRH